MISIHRSLARSVYLTAMVLGALLCLLSISVGAQEGGIFVLGGNRGTGLEIVKLLRDRGENVTVLVRATSDVTALEPTGAAMVVGDAMDKATIDAGLATGSFRLFISTINGRTPSGERADAQGNVNAIEAAKEAGVPHFVLLSTIGAGGSIAALPPPLRAVLQGSIDAKNVAEGHLMQSGLTYTVVRPGGLNDDPPSGRGVLLEDETVLASIGRAELAKLTVDVLYDPGAQGKIYSAIEQ